MSSKKRYYARIPFKIVVVGDPAVGKTTLIQKYTKKIYRDEYLPTLGVEITSKEIDVETPDGMEHINLIFWDLSGQLQFSKVRSIFYSGVKVILFMYDITNSKSFKNINYWVNEARLNTENLNGVLIGNKIDLVNERIISKSEGIEKSKTLNFPFFETSCKTHEGIDEMFNSIIESLIHKNILNIQLIP
ncbi:MAG: Rab family GTPase [Candidatus Helarchaeota archaeon]